MSLRPLSKGLGFSEPKVDAERSADLKADTEGEGPKKPLNKPQGSKAFFKPPMFLQAGVNEVLDLEDPKTYQALMANLSSPWLGTEEAINHPLKPLAEHKKLSSIIFPPPATKATSSANTQQTNTTTKATSSADTQQTNTTTKATSSANTQQTNTTTKATTTSTLPNKQTNAELNKTPALNMGPKKIFFFSPKAFLVDAGVVALLFFPPLILFTLFTQNYPGLVLWQVMPNILISFLLFAQVYCLLCRVFCFETYGEALLKVRLSTLNSKSGPAIVLFWRFLLSCLTGVITLPICSLIFKKDIMAYLTGLYFQKIPQPLKPIVLEPTLIANPLPKKAT